MPPKTPGAVNTIATIGTSTLWSVASIEQQARLTHDPWEDEIERHLSKLKDKTKDGKDTVTESFAVAINDNGDREWRVASSYLLGDAVLGISADRQTNAVTKRLADVMRTLGWSTGKTIRPFAVTQNQSLNPNLHQSLPRQSPRQLFLWL